MDEAKMMLKYQQKWARWGWISILYQIADSYPGLVESPNTSRLEQAAAVDFWSAMLWIAERSDVPTPDNGPG